LHTTPIDAQSIGAGSSYTSDGFSFGYAANGVSLYYLIAGSGVIDLFFYYSIDGFTFVKDSRAIKRGLTAGSNIVYYPIIPCDAIKVQAVETGGAASAVVTVKLAVRIGQFGDTPVYDGITNAIRIIDYEHHETHSGSSYFCVYSALADTDDIASVRIATPNTTKWAHMVIEIDSGLAATAQLWANTTMTDNASNRITPVNRDFNSENTSGLTICHTPSGSQTGAASLTQYIGAATTNGRVIEGGGTGSRGEFILKQNSAYYIKVTSRADGNSLSIILNWYEHTNR